MVIGGLTSRENGEAVNLNTVLKRVPVLYISLYSVLRAFNTPLLDAGPGLHIILK